MKKNKLFKSIIYKKDCSNCNIADQTVQVRDTLHKSNIKTGKKGVLYASISETIKAMKLIGETRQFSTERAIS